MFNAPRTVPPDVALIVKVKMLTISGSPEREVVDKFLSRLAFKGVHFKQTAQFIRCRGSVKPKHVAGIVEYMREQIAAYAIAKANAKLNAVGKRIDDTAKSVDTLSASFDEFKERVFAHLQS
jgi:hypothetical protein